MKMLENNYAIIQYKYKTVLASLKENGFVCIADDVHGTNWGDNLPLETFGLDEEVEEVEEVFESVEEWLRADEWETILLEADTADWPNSFKGLLSHANKHGWDNAPFRDYYYGRGDFCHRGPVEWEELNHLSGSPSDYFSEAGNMPWADLINS